MFEESNINDSLVSKEMYSNWEKTGRITPVNGSASGSLAASDRIKMIGFPLLFMATDFRPSHKGCKKF